MKKVWVYQCKNIDGWWVGWHESGKGKAKALPGNQPDYDRRLFLA